MNGLTPVIVTTFIDFELEERAVRILAQQGFRIGDRRISGTRQVAVDEIVITDAPWQGSDFPIITIPREAKEWGDLPLHRFLQDQLFPPLATTNPGKVCASVLIIGGQSHDSICDELLVCLNSAGFTSIMAPFEEGDLRGALIPTRRMEERERFTRFANARCALYALSTDQREAGKAHSFIEYHRRIHRHLDLGFVIIGGRKAQRQEISALLAPFMTFLVDGEDDDLFRLPRWHKRRADLKFLEIIEWIGSCHGDSRQSSDQSHRALARRARTSRRVGGSVATTR